MKRTRNFHALMIGLVLCTTAVTPVPSHSSVPLFEQESLSQFQTALQTLARKGERKTLDARHRDQTSFRAYRFLDPDLVLIGVASDVTVDQYGRLVVQQAHGQPMGGHPNWNHDEYSHVLVPANVIPPRH